MGKSTKNQIFKDKAKNRVDDLQGMLTDLQHARKESRVTDIAVLEDRVHEMLREWQAELSVPSPASSHNDCSLGSLGSSFCRLLDHCDEKDDAISPMTQSAGEKSLDESNTQRLEGEGNVVIHEDCGLGSFSLDLLQLLQPCQKGDATSPLTQSINPKPEPDQSLQVGDTGVLHEGCSLGSFSSDLRHLLQHFEEKDDATSALSHSINPEPKSKSVIQSGDSGVFHEGCSMNNTSQEYVSQGVEHYMDSFSNEHFLVSNSLDSANQLHNHQLNLHHNFSNSIFNGNNSTGQHEGDDIHNFCSTQPRVCPPSSATLGPKCALWDCSRPAQGSGWCPETPDYCSSFHANLAWNEGSPGMTPILRSGGIGLTDSALFAALSMKMQGRSVGIPECEGAATKKCPWNTPELFEVTFLEGERIREWLFFDKPRKAYNRGSRKQRLLPDYEGRGWHESRKQPVKEHGGVKRSYYMDPQPLDRFEWHLYEYGINNSVILHRLEFKLADEKKKSPKGKVMKDSVADLQKQMGRLSAEFPVHNNLSVQGTMAK